MITLYQFRPAWGIPNPSHFCVKLETYLRMNAIPYQTTPSMPLLAPQGKLPFIVDQGRKIADTRFIIKYLQQHYGLDPDSGLTPHQQSVACAWQRLLEEHLYWVSMYSRWHYSQQNWQANKQAIFAGLPPLVGDLVAHVYRQRIRQQIRGQGISRLSAEQVFQLGADDLAALAAFLADKAFLMGDEPCAIDASAYGMLINIVACPIESPLKEFALGLPGLIGYCQRMQLRYFPELGVPKTVV